MTTIVKKYPVFEDNQVLTSSQLNSLVEYLDQQNRLTRVSLIGVGILCGLDLSCQTLNDTVQLTVSGGVGVTSEGYLIKMKDCVNTKFRSYTLPEGVLYPPFINPVSDEQDVTLYEMLTDTADIDEQDEILPIKKDEIEDMVVMLFVECLDKDLKSCLGKSCDQLGIDRFLTIRKLLVSRADYGLIMTRTNGGYQDVQFPNQFSLPKVVMPRTLFLTDQAPSKNYLNYSINFYPAILVTISQLITAMKESYNVYKPILEPSYGGNPFDSSQLAAIFQEWGNYLNGTTFSTLPFLGMQYFADFIKDLTQAYCEFRENACLLTSLCCPDTDRFPKHLTLGVISSNATGNVSTEFRHLFTQPPVYGDQKDLSASVVQLHEKLVAMIENFELRVLFAPIEVEGQIELATKITPSCEKKSLMSERSIPFYYDINKASSFAKLGAFETLWIANQKSKFGREVLSYEKNEPKEPAIDPVRTPLDFDLDPYNFLRIEGHVGKNVKTVMGELEAFKQAKNLSFDIKAVYLGENGTAMTLPECLCADLQTDYSIWRNKCLFMLKSVLSLTSRLGNLLGKQDAVSKAVFSEFRSDKSTFASFANSTDLKTKATGTSKVMAASNVANLNRTGPIKINQAKLTNLSDIQLNVTRDNWHLAGKQIVTSLDKFKVAEKQTNDSRAFASLANKKTPKDFFDFFNNCLCRLIDSMKVDLKDFDLEVWKKEFACTYQTHIEVMKELAGQANNPKAHLQVYLILVIYSAVYRALSQLGIYPYISVGVIAQTLEFRKANFLKSLQFSKFIDKHPGVEHKAGVFPGDTFLLLYLADEIMVDGQVFPPVNKPVEGLEVAAKIMSTIKDLKSKNVKIKPEEIGEKVAEQNNRIVGDFTLPYTCCDDCSDMPNAPLPLNPLALPVCGVVLTNFRDTNEKEVPFFHNYRPLQIKMISHVYERETFKTHFPNQPKFGTAVIEQIDSSFEFNMETAADGKTRIKGEPLKVEQMTYTVDLDQVAKAYKKNPDVGFLVDEFEYEFYKQDGSEDAICKSTVTIFIPIISRKIEEEPQTATVIGRVLNANGGAQFNATVSIKDSNVISVKTTDKGEFTFVDVPDGKQTIVVKGTRFMEKEEAVNIVAPQTPVGDIVVQEFVIINPPIFVNFNKAFDVFGVQPETPQAFKVVNFYVNNTNRYKSNLAIMAKTNTGTIKPVLEASAVLVKDFSETKEVNIKTFNTNFITATKNIDTAMKKADESEKLVLQETMNNLTLSFLSRLSIEQPKKLTATTTKAMTQFGKLATAKKYPELKGAVEEWKENSKGNVSPEFLTNVNSSFKLK